MNFINKLKTRFKIKIIKVLNKLIIEFFFVKNIKNDREIINYLQNIIFYV